MNLAVIGSRTYLDNNVLHEKLDELEEIAKIVSGGAKGADSLAREYAKEKGIPFSEYKPDYKQYGRGAPMVRNRQIVDACDLLIAFWDGKSKGTKYTIDYARREGKQVKIVLF